MSNDNKSDEYKVFTGAGLEVSGPAITACHAAMPKLSLATLALLQSSHAEHLVKLAVSCREARRDTLADKPHLAAAVAEAEVTTLAVAMSLLLSCVTPEQRKQATDWALLCAAAGDESEAQAVAARETGQESSATSEALWEAMRGKTRGDA